MSEGVDTLTAEFKLFSANKCVSCENKKSIDDHEVRLRKIEEYVYKGVAIAALVAPLFYFLLQKMWK